MSNLHYWVLFIVLYVTISDISPYHIFPVHFVHRNILSSSHHQHSFISNQNLPRLSLHSKINTLSRNFAVQYVDYLSSQPISIATEQSSIYTITSAPKNTKGPVLTRFLSWLVRRMVEGRAEFVSGLKVKVKANSSIDIICGKVGRVDITFDKICYRQLYCSGGGRVTIDGLELRMRRLLFKNKQPLHKSYEVFGDLLLTQADIVNSKFIRNLIQLLVNVIVERAFTTITSAIPSAISSPELVRIAIRRVSIKNQRLFVYGDAILGNNSLTTLAFEVSTGAGVRDNGHVIYLRDIQLVVNPDHPVLRTTLPIILTTPIDVDIGDDCNIISLVIGDKHIWIRARSTISPQTLASVISNDSNNNNSNGNSNNGTLSTNVTISSSSVISPYVSTVPSQSYSMLYGPIPSNMITSDSIISSTQNILLNTTLSSNTMESTSMIPPKKALYRYDVAALLSNVFRMSGGIAVRWVNGKKGSLWNRYKSPR